MMNAMQYAIRLYGGHDGSLYTSYMYNVSMQSTPK